MALFDWVRRSHPPTEERTGRAGLELNATCVRAVTVQPGRPPRKQPLDEPFEALPLAVSLEKRTAEVGRAGLALCRQTPHLAIVEFLPALGQPRFWEAGRHRLSAADALGLVLARVREPISDAGAVAAALPVYLGPSQVALFGKVAERVKLPVRGTAVLPLALAAGVSDQTSGAVLVVDADDHALTATVVGRADGLARVLTAVVLPRLGVRAWKDRLLDALADRCVRACRRDPRDSAAAEQALYDQIEDALSRFATGQKVGLTVRGSSWFQELEQRPEDFDHYCTGMVRQTVAALRDAENGCGLSEPPSAVWVTSAAGRLSGLVRTITANMAERTTVHVLPSDLPARAMAGLARRWLRHDLPPGHLDQTAPLAEPEPRALPARRSSSSDLSHENR